MDEHRFESFEDNQNIVEYRLYMYTNGNRRSLAETNVHLMRNSKSLKWDVFLLGDKDVNMICEEIDILIDHLTDTNIVYKLDDRSTMFHVEFRCND